VVLTDDYIGRARRRFSVTVQDIWVEVQAVGPADRAGQLVDAYLREVAGVPKWLEQAALREDVGEVEVTDESVREGQPEAVIAERLDGGDPGQCSHAAARLAETLNRPEGGRDLRQLPVRDEFVSMQVGPLPDQPCGGRRKIPTGKRAVGDPDQGLVRPSRTRGSGAGCGPPSTCR
jgi:hypothetical protein